MSLQESSSGGGKPTMRLLVPHTAIGSIIGMAGKRIKKLMEETGT